MKGVPQYTYLLATSLPRLMEELGNHTDLDKVSSLLSKSTRAIINAAR